MSANPYELLEVSPNATAEEIKSAYLRLAKQWHPDRFSGAEKADAEARFRALNEAYTAVKDPARRSMVPAPQAGATAPEPAPSGTPDKSAKDWYEDAKAAFDKNDLGRALALVQYAIRQDSRQASFHALQGQALERMGDGRKALKSYEAAIALNAKDADTIIRMADIYQMEGMKARAESMLQTAKRIAPNHRRFKPTKAAVLKTKGAEAPAGQGSLADQAKALWGRLTGKG
ncbi:MAG: DnaJ domain-containing protein [Acidobacteria bacterium]|nr:DnaJ domain-containing protein [Acidobacteriota bacterium]